MYSKSIFILIVKAKLFFTGSCLILDFEVCVRACVQQFQRRDAIAIIQEVSLNARNEDCHDDVSENVRKCREDFRLFFPLTSLFESSWITNVAEEIDLQ
jgi:hypothetical protein